MITHESSMITLIHKGGKILVIFMVLAMILAVHHLATRPEKPLIYNPQAHAPDFRNRDPKALMDGLRTLLNTGKFTKEFVIKWADVLRYPIHIDVWQNQKFLGETMGFGLSVPRNLIDLYRNYQALSKRMKQAVPSDAVVFLTLLHHPKQYDPLSAKTQKGLNDFLKPGIHALIVQCEDTQGIMPGLRWATRSFVDGWHAANAYLEWVGCDSIKLEGGIGAITRFKTTEWVQYNAHKKPEKWQAADRIASLNQSPIMVANTLLDAQAHWLDRHLTAEGQLPYIYDPLTDSVSSDNQLIRQWFAILALGTLAERTPTLERKEHFLRAVDYALKNYYAKESSGGYFILNHEAFLATNAVAAQALAIASDYNKKYRLAYEQVIRTIWSKKKADGTFSTTILPETNTENDADFAPGISIQALVQAIQLKALDAKVTDLTPSFLAYYHRWQQSKSLYGAAWNLVGLGALERALKTPNPAIEEAMFAMADELVRCQVTENDIPAPYRGGFNREGCNQSSLSLTTLVRIEGLSNAYRLAEKRNNTVRKKAYGESIKQALRLVLQGTIDTSNSFYMKVPEKAIGAMRYGPLQPYIRIDSPGHAVMALTQISKYVDLK